MSSALVLLTALSATNRRYTYTADYESAFEVYYSVRLTKWLTVSPDFQYITNPGGDRDVPNATVIGARIQMTF